ncbi:MULTISPECIES: hypothetical protein [Acinetobacter]|uniref:hypothetical protein n=1 Tax=Acinetobacter TaxID=469 RepID=UPI00141B41FC|nr:MULTISPECIES: hypothetical protein [Acinetobacter]MCS4297510.1 hypothetical protein [Acinetobacter guillouiae]MCW2249809.1 hypothetical protein [Acinetobacter sp. BIGb0204]NII38913.1 hypothetical protein [Acinetobacter sp. BIGb0196]
MNKKIILTLLTACLMQACTKNESTEKASSNTAQTEAVKANTSDSQKFIDQGKNDIATYGKETLQYLLDQKYPDRYTAFSVDNVKFLRQQSEDLFLYTWNIRFLDNQSDDVYGCDSQQLSWNKQTSDIESTLNETCFNVLKRANTPASQNETTSTIPATAPVKIALEQNPHHSFITMIKVQSLVDDVSISNVTVNRGNCPLLQKIEKPRQLSFGQTTSVDTSNCGREKIIEVVVSTNQGDWKFGS